MSLFLVPEIPARLRVDNVKEHIKTECERLGVRVPAGFDKMKVNLRAAYLTPERRRILRELRLLAKERGGKLVTTEYRGMDQKARWQCAEGHKWESTPAHVKTGTWCPFCAGKAPHTIDGIREMAAKRSGVAEKWQKKVAKKGVNTQK